MNKERVLAILLTAFLISNLMLMFYIHSEKKSPQGEGGQKNREIIIKRLHFDEKQIVQYDSLIEIHRANQHQANKNIYDLRTELYQQIQNPDSSRTKRLKTQLGVADAEFEMIHYHHFADLRKLCREDQLSDFDSLSKDLARMFSRKPERPHRE